MGLRGPRPQPTALRILNGNPGKRPLPAGEPKPRAGLPTMPEHLSELAQQEWQRIGPILAEIGVITQADRAILGAYCAAYARWVMAEKQIRSASDMIIPGANHTVVLNPYLRAVRQALEEMHKCMVELGLTPASRVKLAKGEPQEVDALEAFLKGKKKAK